MIRLLALLLATLVASRADNASASVRLEGTISIETFPGPPNYENVEAGDARESAWILATPHNERFHLVVLPQASASFPVLRRSVGRKVRVEGQLAEADTGHHRTPFLMIVASVTDQSGADSSPPLLAAAAPNQERPSQNETQSARSASTIEQELKAARKTLADMLLRYTERHPRVVEQRKKISALQQEAENLKQTDNASRPREQ